MSSSSRSTARAGGKNTAVKKNESAPAVSKAHKGEAKKTESTHVGHKATAEQIRMAQTTTIDSKVDDDPKLAEKIKQAMEFTNRPEDEVRLAFHDCDNDLTRAVEYLISEQDKSQWSVTKKKRRAVSTSKPGGEPVANNHSNEAEAEKEEEPEAAVTGNGAAPANNARRGGRRGIPARTNDRSADNRKWKGKEKIENEKNASDSRGGGRDGFRRDRGDRGGRGMANGSVGRGGLSRGGRGAGRGGGRLSSRTYQPRGDKPGLSRTIDTWNNPSTENSATEKMGNWENDFPVPEEWDNEEYTGSLADSKVFTPSTAVPENSTVEASPTAANEDMPDLISSNKEPPPQTQQVSAGVMGMGSLTAAQTQFLSQFSHSNDALKQPSSAAAVTATTQSNSYSSMYQTSSESEQQSAQTNSYQSVYHPSSQSITSTYSTSSVPYPPNSYGNSIVSSYNVSLQDVTSQSQSMPPRNKPQRARVPPPSKIPSSAVEMPPADGSVSSSIGFLDVQFGGLEFGTNDTSFDSSLVNSTEQNKYSSTNTSLNSTTNAVTSLAELTLQNSSNVAPVSIDPYANLSSVSSQQKPTQPSNVSSVLSQASKSMGQDSLLQTTTDKQSSSSMGGYTSQTASQNVRSTSTALQDLANAAAKTASVGAGDVPSLSSYGVPDTAPSYNQQSSATSVYQKPNSSSVSSYHQPSQSLGSSYNASSYSNPSQVTSSSIAYSSGGNQSQGSSYTPVTNSSYNSQQSSYTSNSYQPSSNYSTYPSYPNSQTYQNNAGGQSGGYQNQSSYGSGNSSSLSGNSSSYGAPYPNTYNSSNTSASQQNHKISSSSLSSSSVSKESQVKYDTGSTAISTAAPALSSLSQTTISSTKVSSTATGGAKSGMVASLPPGVPPQMMGAQYIMSQGNVPAYFQQPIYSFEDLHMIPQRLPPVPTGYYDISAASYQAPTSLAAGRDGMPSVAYSMSDARFTRTDNNASPVSSTISQQNASQAHQQPLMNPAFQPASYATYYIAGTPSVLPTNFYGPPGALYPMTPTAASAGGHSTATSGQYGKGPGAYGTAAGYGTGYDANGLSGQSGNDYKSSGGYANAQSQSGKGVSASNNPTQTTSASASDLGTANMYSKSQHSVLAKVNSFDKQGFHSGNPPPFPMPGNQSAGAYPPVFISGIAPSNPMVQSGHPLHVDLRNQARRTDSSNSAGSRAPASAQPNKTGSKPSYSTSTYWPQN